MSQSLHHLGVLGPLGCMLSLYKSEHSNPLSQCTEDKWEDKTERSSVWTWTKLHSLTLWTCKEIWRWMEWKWMLDSCFAAKMNMLCVMWCHYNGHCFTEGYEWAGMWTAVIDKTERPEGSCQWCGAAASCTKSPVAAFNLRRPWLICCALPSTQTPNKSCSLELRRMASQ